MKKRFLALIFYSLFWLLFFFVARLFFFLSQFKETSGNTFSSVAGAFWHGLQLDISATGYILVIPMLVLITGIFFNSDRIRIFIKLYSYLILFICSLIIVADSLLYKYWGFRMDHTVLFYLRTPKEVIASVTTIQIIGVVLVVLLIFITFLLLYNKFIDKFFKDFEKIRLRIPAFLFFLFLLASLLIPIRGGFGIAPINAGTVYFNKNIFINHAAVNVIWNVGNSVFNRKPTTNPYSFMDLKEAVAIRDSLTAKSSAPMKVLNNQRPDIMIVVLESFGNSLIGPLGGDSLTTPNLNSLCNEGVLFTNFYASGNRTDKAMPAILNGYPAQPTESIMKEPGKTQSLPGIVKILKEAGYNTSFWYGGEINFANFNSFIINNGFDRMITMDDFDPKFYNSKWGVHDHIFLNTLSDSMKNVREPFFNVILTLSSHEPFDVPMEPVFVGNDDYTKFRNSVYYTDKALGAFIESAKKSEWWNNTLVIIIADHCRRNSEEVYVYSEDIFRIPMLWIGGAVSSKGLKITKTGSQVDIPLTLLHQLGLEGDFPFGKDLLSDGSDSFAFYTFNDGFAFFTDSSGYIYDNVLGNAVLKSGMDPERAGDLGKAYLQVSFEDFLNR